MTDQCPHATVAYRTRPFVCGAIGQWSTATLQRLRAASPSRLREIHRSATATLWATDRLAAWGTRSEPGYFWGSLASGATPARWQDAAEDRLAAGLQVTGQGAVLHGDGLGLQDLYYRRVGTALYFAARIGPLLDIDGSRLGMDWQAWASIIALSFPLGTATPFREVRRMPPATAWYGRHDGIRQLRFEPGWLDVEPEGRVSASDVVDIIARQIATGGKRRPAMLLSGGWDSRLLAVLARRRWRRIRAWTTSNDDGYDRDITISRQVAKALQLKHRVVIPGPEAWLDERVAVHHRIEFQTSHHVWLMPLARSIHLQEDRLLDGLAGDVLFKNLFVPNDLATCDQPAKLRRSLWDRLEQRRVQQRQLLAPGVAAALESRSREAFESVLGRFDGHPAAATLGVLHTRTARGIGASPQWLLGPEVDVMLPFVHPHVLSSGLRVPLRAKMDGEFYRQMLQAADPVVAALPSTNDGGARGRRGAVRHTSQPALCAVAQSISADDQVLRLLSPELRLALRQPGALALLARSTQVLRLLHGLSMLSEWRLIHASRLGGHDADPR